MSTLFISKAGAKRAGNDMIRRDKAGAYIVRAHTGPNADTRQIETGYVVLMFDKPAGVYAFTL